MDGKSPEKWFQYLMDFSREVSQRYGDKIAGWGYIDSTVPGYELKQPTS